MTEIVDELMTPGCPQCAVKHLCAALSYVADHNGGDEQMGEDYVLAARALINIAEAEVGYKSHRDFAIGLLERAERTTLIRYPGSASDFIAKARRLRLAMISGATAEEHVARQELDNALHPASYMWAHLVEAARELPGMHIPTGNPAVPEIIQGILQAVRDEYFSLPEVTVAEGEKTTKEKEPTMATAKKKAPVKAAKATHAACKGGKCKGKSCKK